MHFRTSAGAAFELALPYPTWADIAAPTPAGPPRSSTGCGVCSSPSSQASALIGQCLLCCYYSNLNEDTMGLEHAH